MLGTSPFARNPMAMVLDLQESQLFLNVPEGDLIDLAAELELSIPERIERNALIGSAIEALARLARREGLPFSDYDKVDLEELPPAHLAALAALIGSQPTVSAILKSGRKVYRTYRKTRTNSPVALMMPMLIGPLARYASETR
jgi:hypothetical protein